MANSLNIRKGDTAVVISGKDKGRQGRVLEVRPKDETVLIESVNMVKKHRKPRSQTQPGGILTQEAPIPRSKVMVVCEKCGKATRIGHKTGSDGTKVRVCKKCGNEL